MMTFNNRSFDNKCKCGHLESDHKPQTVDSPKSVAKFQFEPKDHLPVGVTPNISYDTNRVGISKNIFSM